MSVRDDIINGLSEELVRVKQQNADLLLALQEIRDILQDTQVEYHTQGMGCGLEDRGIHDRYDAARYGWDEAIDRMHDEVIQHAIRAADDAVKQHDRPVAKGAGGQE